MRVHLKRSSGTVHSQDAGANRSISDSDGGTRISQRRFLKTLATAVGAVGAATLVSPLGSAEAAFESGAGPNGTDLVTASVILQGATPGYFPLDVQGSGRMRVRDGTNGNAGIFFYQSTPAADRGFVGMMGDDYVGLWGASASWAFVMNVTSGNVGIGTTSPGSKLVVSGPINANGNYGVIFPGTDNWDSLHWNVSTGWLRIGVSGGAFRVEGSVALLGTLSVNGTQAIDASGIAMTAHQAYYS